MTSARPQKEAPQTGLTARGLKVIFAMTTLHARASVRKLNLSPSLLQSEPESRAVVLRTWLMRSCRISEPHAAVIASLAFCSREEAAHG